MKSSGNTQDERQQVKSMSLHKRVWILILCLVVVFVTGCRQPVEEILRFYEQPRQIIKERTVQQEESELPVITIYSQVSDYFGSQNGWAGKLLEERFGVKVVIVPYQEEAEFSYGDPDIVVFSRYSEAYDSAVKTGMLLDLTEKQLLGRHGAYISEHFQKMLAKNQERSNGEGIYGIAGNVSSSGQDHEDFRYTWGIRWDLYRQLGYPKVQNLEQLKEVMEQMKEICPKDENGKETYAYSLWSDWDHDMPYCMKSMVAAYYGKEPFGMGFYDVKTGTYTGCLEEEDYIACLRFFYTLYRDGLLDPESRYTTEEDVVWKLLAGNNLCSMMEHAGCVIYNSDEHLSDGKIMCPLVPKEAEPVVAGISEEGTGPVFTITKDSLQPEICMELIDYLFSPEGVMELTYGPKGVTWDYDIEEHMCLTDLGKEISQNGDAVMPEEWGEQQSFTDGVFRLGTVTWNLMAKNPDSQGEVFLEKYWFSNNRLSLSGQHEDWKDYTGYSMFYEYLDHTNYQICPSGLGRLEVTKQQRAECWTKVENDIINGSWRAVCSLTDEEFEADIQAMKETAVSHGYEKCIEWGREAVHQQTGE